MKLNLNFEIRDVDDRVVDKAATIVAHNLQLFPKSRHPVKMLDIAHKLKENPEIDIDAEDLQKLEEEITQYEIATFVKGALLEAIIKAKK